MNDKQKNNQNPKTGLIDRRFFLKASSATAAVIAAATIPTLAAEDTLSTTENNPDKIPVTPDDNNETQKHWRAGWMAF